MTIDQQKKADVEQSQSSLAHDELNDSQLEKVAAGSRPNRSTPLDTHSAKNSDNFSRH